MAYQKLQVSNAIAVIPSDTIDIPNPALYVASGSVVGTDGDFVYIDIDIVELGVKSGFLVVDSTQNVIGTVDMVYSTTIFSLNGITAAMGDTFSIYDPSYREGCVLYVGTGGDVNITTWGGQTVVFSNVASGSYIPVQTRRVNETATTASNIVALW